MSEISGSFSVKGVLGIASAFATIYAIHTAGSFLKSYFTEKFAADVNECNNKTKIEVEKSKVNKLAICCKCAPERDLKEMKVMKDPKETKDLRDLKQESSDSFTINTSGSKKISPMMHAAEYHDDYDNTFHLVK